MKILLLLLFLAYLGVAALAYFISDRLIFLPPPSSYREGELPIVHLPVEEGGTVAVLHLPRASASHTLVFSHGNAEDLGDVAGLLARLGEELDVGVLGYDYRGYGLSAGGPPTAHGALGDAETVYSYLTDTLGIPPDRLILHGRSVGTGPALHLAAGHPVGGVVVESGFVSAFRVLTHVPLLPFDRFPNLRHIRGLRVPVLVIHGEDDEVIPIRHGRRLFAAAPGPKEYFWVEGAGHNDLLVVAGESYWKALRRFVERLDESARKGNGARATGD